jgi:hypothetical protein
MILSIRIGGDHMTGGVSNGRFNLRAPQTIPWRKSGAPDGYELDRVFIGADPAGRGFQVAVASLSLSLSRKI